VKLFRFFAVGAALLAFTLAILGSWVRINGAGMTCPDWPLCRGALVPQLVGGVVLEWLHRAVALTEGFLILGVFITGWRVRKRIAWIAPTLGVLVSIFVLQIIVGGITIHESNSPRSVVLHWGIAMALLATLTVLALLAVTAPAPSLSVEPMREGSPFAVIVLAALCALATMLFGSYVSSSGAGLACATFPSCNGTLLGTTQPQLAQMLHRLAASLFVVVALVAGWFAVRSRMARAGAWTQAGVFFALLQFSLGVANVVWQMPTWLREAHAANAAVTFLVFVIAGFFALVEPSPERSPALRR